jgi:hypothetical protein
VTVEIRTASEVLTPERLAAWQARRAQRADPVLRAIWRELIDREGPVALQALSVALPGLPPDVVRTRVAALDVADLIEQAGDEVRLAYPFSAAPTDFEVILPGARSRYACCAIDALGVAPMLEAGVTVRSRCHRSGEPLLFEVDPAAGPRPAPPGVLVWIEDGRWGGDRLSGFL